MNLSFIKALMSSIIEVTFGIESIGWGLIIAGYICRLESY